MKKETKIAREIYVMRNSENRTLKISIIFVILIFLFAGVSYQMLHKTEFKITKENCWNNTSPYNEFPIIANDFTYVGSSKGDRFEVISCEECNLTEATKNVFYGNPNESCSCDCEPFCFYNNNSFRVILRVYEKPMFEVCEPVEVDRIEKNDGEWEFGGVCYDNHCAITREDLTIEWLDSECECIQISFPTSHQGKQEGILNPNYMKYKCGEYFVEVIQ